MKQEDKKKKDEKEKQEEVKTNPEEKDSREETKDETKESREKGRNVFEEFGDQVGQFATKTFESLKKSIDKAMVARNTVLTIRVNDEANEKLTMLVETGLFKSRSESAAFLIEEGIKYQEPLFDKVEKKMEEINKLKEELKGLITGELK
ncbi:MAG: hypothetical protein KAW12_09995 [Candidatus Aminicenantes bacterium]|nr:hypothetical protein [Candidatus Aminicenantes bacterium]